MVSPYIDREAKRLGIGSYSSPDNYRFARQRADRLYVPLEQSPPALLTWAKPILAGLLLIALTATLFYLPTLLAG